MRPINNRYLRVRETNDGSRESIVFYFFFSRRNLFCLRAVTVVAAVTLRGVLVNICEAYLLYFAELRAVLEVPRVMAPGSRGILLLPHHQHFLLLPHFGRSRNGESKQPMFRQMHSPEPLRFA